MESTTFRVLPTNYNARNVPQYSRFELENCKDQVLSAMQEELDSLCEQVNYFKDKSDDMYQRSSGESLSGGIKYGGCDCQPCDFHQLPYDDMMGSAISEFSKWEDTFMYQPC